MKILDDITNSDHAIPNSILSTNPVPTYFQLILYPDN